MRYFLAEWCRQAKKHPSLLEVIPQGVLESAFQVLVDPPRRNRRHPRLSTESSSATRMTTLLSVVPPKVPIFIDSGAYTLLTLLSSETTVESGISHVHLGNESHEALKTQYEGLLGDEKALDAYHNLYTNLIEKLYPRIFLFSELDLMDIVGLDKVYRWRINLINRGLGEKMLIVWKEGIQPLDSFCRDVDRFSSSRYVGVTWMEDTGITAKERYFEVLESRGIRVHGFGITACSETLKVPYESVDGTRWKAPLVWGQFHKFCPVTRNLIHVPLSPKTDRWERFVRQGRHPIKDLGLLPPTSWRNREILLGMQVKEINEYADAVTSWWERKRGTKSE